MSKKLKVDFTGVESYVRCEEGQHIAKLVELEEKVSQNGSDMLAAVFEVTKGDSKGAKLFDNFVLTEKALWKLKSFLEIMNMKAEGRVVIDLDKLIGRLCIVEVTHEEYNGQVRARITGFKALTEKAEKAPYKKGKPADDDDDDDDDWEE